MFLHEQKLKLGTGRSNSSNTKYDCMLSAIEFWKTEERENYGNWSKDNKIWEKHFKLHVSRHNTGRCIAALPCKTINGNWAYQKTLLQNFLPFSLLLWKFISTSTSQIAVLDKKIKINEGQKLTKHELSHNVRISIKHLILGFMHITPIWLVCLSI